MKFISFNKYKAYLESLGYKQERGTNEYPNLSFKSYFFSRPNETYKYVVNKFIKTDDVISIAYGFGSPYLGYKSVKIDMRKKFWKNLTV